MIPTLLLTILAAVALAPEGDSPGKRGRGHRGDAMCETLECTEAQKKEMKEIRAQLRTDLEDERAEKKRLRAAFVAEKQKADPDPEAIAKLRGEMDANREAMRTEFEEAKVAMRAVLDEKQEEKLDEALAKRKHGKGHGHGKGHDHGKGKAHGKGKDKAHGKDEAHGKGKAHGKPDKAKGKDKAHGKPDKSNGKPDKPRGKDKSAKKNR